VYLSKLFILNTDNFPTTRCAKRDIAEVVLCCPFWN